MSDGNESVVSRGSATNSAGGAPGAAGGASGVETAKNEATEVTHTATDAAKDVGQLAKDEAGSVVGEAKDQLQGLYEQTRSELSDEASKQQERIATGLQTVGDDLGSMARASEDGGIARELVREASQRVGRVAAWLNEREPGAVLDEVKTFARRQPGVFIGAAAVAGLVAGRLTRALASNAKEESSGAQAKAPDTRSGQETSISTAGGSGAHAAPVVLPGTESTAPLSEPGAAPRAEPGIPPLGEPGADPRRGLATDPTREEATDDRPHTL